MNRMLLVLMLALLFQGCGQSNHPVPAATTKQSPGVVDTAAFVTLFKDTGCAETRNRLFLIDGALVLHDRSGNCPDNGYELTLYDGTPESRLEDVADSIAGPMWLVSTPDYLSLFQTIQANLDKADLGLGSGHAVVEIPMASAAVDTAAFVALFKNSDCADVRNRLFLIDGALVLWDRYGNSCPDNGYQLTLFDGTPSIRLEDLADSIAGPIWLVSTPDHLQMFQTIQANLDKADLGLGTGHTVVQVPMQ